MYSVRKLAGTVECDNCIRTIPQGEIVLEHDYMGVPDYYCIRCGKDLLKEEIDEMQMYIDILEGKGPK